MSGAARESELVNWIKICEDLISLKWVPPPEVSLLMAQVTMAQFLAINSISPSFETYRKISLLTLGSQAIPSAAAAQASYDILIVAFPDQSDRLIAALEISLEGLAPEVRKDSVDLGTAAAAAMFVNRSYDGSNSGVAYTVPASPAAGDWVPTEPRYAAYLLPHWANVKPWSMKSGSQFRPSPPPAPGSAKYNSEYEEVKSLGSRESTKRTADETNIAKMWAAGPGTVTPPGQWFQIAIQLVQNQEDMSLENQARLFALLGICLADAAIAAWDAKLEYHTWRPITAIRTGSMGVVTDPTWTPLLNTPPFPGFVSGHSTFSAAGATILASVLGSDAQNFTVASEGISKDFNSLWRAAEEAGRSRILGGIHFQADNIGGLSLGVKIAKVAYSTLLRPVPRDQASI